MPDTLNIQIIPPGVTKWGGKVVLTAHGCALGEHFTGKSYGYRAVNLETKDWSYLCHVLTFQTRTYPLRFRR